MRIVINHMKKKAVRRKKKAERKESRDSRRNS